MAAGHLSQCDVADEMLLPALRLYTGGVTRCSTALAAHSFTYMLVGMHARL